MEKEAYTGRTLAEATDLPRQTIDHAIKSGDLKAVKSGKRFIILREDAIAWLRQCRARGSIPSGTVTQAGRERLAELNRARKASA